MRRHTWILGFFLGLFLLGCDPGPASDQPADGPDDSFLAPAGKADTGGIVEGSVDGLAILELASKASLSELVNEVGLYKLTAQNIVSHRKKNGPFTSLAELDKVKYVGPVAFWAMLTYIQENNLTSGTTTIVKQGDPLVVGKYRYVLHNKLLLKEHEVPTLDGSNTFVLWQLHVKADYLTWDSKNGRLIAFGAENLYVIHPLGWVVKVFDKGYADIPNLKLHLLTGATTCAIYQNLVSYYQGKAFGAYMIGNVVAGNIYTWWRYYFQGLYAFSLCV
jgi:hypothetical protein